MGEFDLDVEFDDQGNVILPNGNNDNIPRKKISMPQDDDFVNENDLQEYMDQPHIDDKEIIGKPKLSKSGLPRYMKPQTRQIEPESNQILDENFSMNDVQLNTSNTKPNNPIKLLVLSAKRVEHNITIELKLNALDKNLFNVLSESYPDDKDVIMDVILDQNKNELQELIRKSISNYYGKIE